MSAYTQAADEMREAGERHRADLRETAHALREVVKAPDPDTRAAAHLRLDAAYHRMRHSRAELEQKTLAFLEVAEHDPALFARVGTARLWPGPPLEEDPPTYGDPQ